MYTLYLGRYFKKDNSLRQKAKATDTPGYMPGLLILHLISCVMSVQKQSLLPR